MAAVRVALVSPYSYTYPGGVGRHVEALAQELTGLGHEVRLLAPYDPDDRLARVLHRGASPQPRPLPDYVIPLGRTFGLPMNGAVTNLAGPLGESIGVLGRELRSGDYDVVHVHEPNVPVVSWYATEAARVPVVGTFHTYSTSAAVEQVHRELPRRPAALLQAERTHRRVRGGRLDGAALLRRALPDRAERRRPVRRATRSVAPERGAEAPVRRPRRGAQGPAGAAARLRGAARRGRSGTPHGGRLHGRGGRAAAARARGRGARGPGRRRREVAAARRGRPALRSLARRRELRHGAHRGVRLGHAGRGLRHRRLPRRGAARHGRRARAHAGTPWSSARRCARWPSTPTGACEWPRPRASAPSASPGRTWPARSRRSTSRRSSVPEADRRRTRVAQRAGIAPAEPGPRVRPERLPSLEPKDPTAGRRRVARTARRVLVAAGVVAGAGLAVLALQRLGIQSIGRAIVAATPVWVLVAFALMCASMLLRAEAWHAILRAALPGTRVRRRDTARGNDDRRADVRDPAGATRRALARADRGEARGTRARPLPDRARHARLPDAPEPARADRARGRDVQHRRPLPGQRGRAGGRHDRARGRPGARDLGAVAAAARQAEPLPARAAGRRARSAARCCRCARGCRSSASRSWADGRP